MVIPGLKAEVVEAEDGLADSVSTDLHSQQLLHMESVYIEILVKL